LTISTLVDSNVILDFVDETAPWSRWSEQALRNGENDGDLIINPIIYAEATVLFKDRQGFEKFVPVNRFIREPIPFDAAFLAGKVHFQYRREGGMKDRTLPDFLIGAHAVVQGYRLLTRDARRYRTYFPKLDIIAPDTHP
jgi:predicted nucleic acid-binding protein